jgi:membrane-associated protease RseP (regulator of RpoE activity)
MVLTLKRAACVALILGLWTIPALAQQSSAPKARSGDIRPLLYGFALECIDCAPGEHGRGRGSGGQPPVLSYRSFPHVIAVAPASAAEQAGIRAGDILQSIDGISVITDAGAQRLARAKAGQQVRLAFERDAKPVVVSLKLGVTPTERTRSGPHRIFGGYVAMQGSVRGNVKLEIWSDDPIVPSDPVVEKAGADSTGSIVLRIGTNTLIKLQFTKNSADSSAKRPDQEGMGNKPDGLPRLLRLPEAR